MPFFLRREEFASLIIKQIKTLLAYLRVCTRDNSSLNFCTLLFKKAMRILNSSIMLQHSLDFGLT